jgi:nicotinamide mononucleotide (NMN) deamidase PncC
LLACCNEARVACGVDASIMKGCAREDVEVAMAMAETVRRNMNTDVGMGVTGNLNIVENSGEAFIGLSCDKFEQTFAHKLRGNLSRMMQRTVYAALFDLRRMLLEEVQCT